MNSSKFSRILLTTVQLLTLSFYTIDTCTVLVFFSFASALILYAVSKVTFLMQKGKEGGSIPLKIPCRFDLMELAEQAALVTLSGCHFVDGAIVNRKLSRQRSTT